jgi:hypothetical protein
VRLVCLAAAASLAACFGPRLNGEISCEANGLCPPGLGCFDGVCRPEAPGSDPDAAPDGPEVDATPLCLSFDGFHVDTCALPDPGAPLDLDGDGAYIYDTDDGTLTDPDGKAIDHPSVVIDGVRVVSIDGLTLRASATLRPAGALPLMIASFDSITVAGIIDIDSGGAGANHDCDALAPARGGDNPTGAGGGGGGGFGTDGGDGGDADSNGTETAGGAGGQALAAPPAAIRGGCEGADGGDGDPGSDGRGGDSGGAIQLTARVSIAVTGTIDAGGEGGINGELIDGGGGGGGSGGYIGLDAPMIALTGATVVANGGGGGEGADDTTAGAPGDDGNRDASRAQGGAGGADGASDGGEGGVLDADGDSVPGVPTGGGGGGGGGVGFVLTRGVLDVSGGTVSPAPRPLSNAGSN